MKRRQYDGRRYTSADMPPRLRTFDPEAWGCDDPLDWPCRREAWGRWHQERMAWAKAHGVSFLQELRAELGARREEWARVRATTTDLGGPGLPGVGPPSNT